MDDIVIVSATRTAVGKFGGALAKIPAPELGATVIRALLAQGKIAPDQVSEVILGQVLTAGSGQNPAPGYVNVDKYGTPEVRCDLAIELVVPLPGFVKRRAEVRILNTVRELKVRAEA